ncbi:hypothetical protein NVV24_13330 [Acinetobacter radioresistens]|uniref:hypothetical protein n=1 Tax=Acinetobacter radioresistens TaxID=40216 RepID=UPI002247D3CD|nr:hypothetical protein [Acinetobacter radioresistens]MCX0343621.1 hypothetical protein [Acinetobacter radioresistens]
MTKHDNVSQEGIMKATEFVKRHGWEYAKGIVVACESGFLPKNQNYTELKRLVESHELVEAYGGLADCKNHIDYISDDMKQAIADVEACQ